MISVCIASYQGEKYIREQIVSILSQIEENDEVIVSDDNSNDTTIAIIKELNDRRITIISNTGQHGPVGNFENALKCAKGEYIFLADQDDIWLPGRVEKSIHALRQPHIDCVLCNRIIIDKNGHSNGKPVVLNDVTKKSFVKVLTKNPYMGCCMAFTRKHLDLVLPFPKDLPMHDLWIGLIAHKLKKVDFISEPLIAYRRHGENVTSDKSPYSIFYRVIYRVRLIFQIYNRLHFS